MTGKWQANLLWNFFYAFWSFSRPTFLSIVHYTQQKVWTFQINKIWFVDKFELFSCLILTLVFSLHKSFQLPAWCFCTIQLNCIIWSYLVQNPTELEAAPNSECVWTFLKKATHRFAKLFNVHSNCFVILWVMLP